MAEVLINQKSVNTTEETTINDLCEKIFNSEDKNNVITEMIVDGESYYYEQDLDILGKNVNGYKSVYFKTSTSIDLAFEALDSCQGYINTLNDKIIELVTDYRENRIGQADLLFNEVIEILDLYIQLVSKIFATIKKQRPSVIIENKDIQNLEIHLLSILKALLPAKERNDIIMLCDLLEYELVDNLTQWKIKVIPGLKKLRSL